MFLFTAAATLQVDNHRVRATRLHFPPGLEIGWHKHNHDYVVVPTLVGTKCPTPWGKAMSAPQAPSTTSSLSGTAVELVEIELK